MRAKRIYQQISKGLAFAIRDPLRMTTAFAVVVLIGLIIGSWDLYWDSSEHFLNQVLAEFHGIVAEIIILGILLVWVNRYSEKWKTIEHAREQISDLKSLRNEHANVMILSAIKALNRNGVFKINLRNVSLPNAPLDKVILIESDLNGVKLTGASMIEAKLTGSALTGAVLRRVNLFHSDLSAVSANAANFSRANLVEANLSNAKFIMANFQGTYLNDSNFSGSNVLHANFDGAHLSNVDFRGCRELTVEQLRMAIVRDCIFDEELEIEWAKSSEHHP